MNADVTLNTKLTADEKRKFVETAEALGLSSSSALKVFVRKFIEVVGGRQKRNISVRRI